MELGRDGGGRRDEKEWQEYLASEGAEAEGVEEAALADVAGVGDALAGPGLRALVEEHDARAVDDVGLHAGDVQHLLDLRHADHVVVRGPPYLPAMEQYTNKNRQREARDEMRWSRLFDAAYKMDQWG